MNKLKPAFIIDLSFIFIAIFFLAFGFLKSVIKSTPVTLIFSAVIAAIISAAYLAVVTSNEGKKAIKRQEEDTLNALSEKLALSPSDYVLELLIKYFEFKNKSVKKENGHISFVDEKAVLKFDFNPEGAPIATLINEYKSTDNKIIFIANKYSDETIKLFANKSDKIKLYTLSDLYLSLKSANLLPVYSPPKNKKLNFKNVLPLKREKAGRLLYLGIILIILSSFTYFSGFYIIFGAALIITAITLRFFKKPQDPLPIGIDI